MRRDEHKPTVWIVNQYVGAPRYGMHYRWYYLARHLSEQGIDTKVVSGSYSHHLIYLPPSEHYYNYETIDGIDYCWVKLNRYSNNKGVGRIISQILFAFKTILRKPFPNKPDVIVASSPSLFSVLIGWYYSKRFRAKLIFEVRDLWPLTLTTIGRHSRMHPLILLFSRIERFGYKRAHATVSLLPNAIAYMRSAGLDENKYHYIPNGVELPTEFNRETELPPEIDRIIGMLTTKFLVTYAGSIGISNAMDCFVDAAIALNRRDDRFVFLIIGEGSEKERLASKVRGTKNIVFQPYVRRDVLRLVFAKSDVLYCGVHDSELYSKYGISLNKLFEYMSSMKPVVFSSSAFNDPVGDADAGITVPAGDSQLLCNAILEMANSTEQERNRQGRNGYDYVKEFHTYHILAQQYGKLFS